MSKFSHKWSQNEKQLLDRPSRGCFENHIFKNLLFYYSLHSAVTWIRFRRVAKRLGNRVLYRVVLGPHPVPAGPIVTLTVLTVFPVLYPTSRWPFCNYPLVLLILSPFPPSPLAPTKIPLLHLQAKDARYWSRVSRNGTLRAKTCCRGGLRSGRHCGAGSLTVEQRDGEASGPRCRLRTPAVYPWDPGQHVQPRF